MQKKTLSLQRNQIFNQGCFFFWGGGAIWRIVRNSEKILALAKPPVMGYRKVNPK